jgi:hypothetical protein
MVAEYCQYKGRHWAVPRQFHPPPILTALLTKIHLNGISPYHSYQVR